MSVKINSKGLAHARALVTSGKVNKTASWSFSAEDGNKLLGANGDAWDEYAKWFMGEDDSAAEKTKDRYKYPFGKSGEVYRSALTAIRQRAGQQDATEIFDAAGKLLDEIDGHVEGKIVYVISDAAADMSSSMTRPPNEIQLIPIGTWKGYRSGADKNDLKEFTVTPDDVESMCDNFRRIGRDLVIDYEHQSLSGREAPAAGWIKALINKGNEGLWAFVQWTDRALEYLKNKEYRFLSPVFTLSGTDSKSGDKVGASLFNAALTNDPFFSDLKPIVSKSTETIFCTKGIVMKNLLAKLCQMFKLAESATEGEIVAKLDAYTKEHDTLLVGRSKIIGVLGLKPEASNEEIEGLIVAGKSTQTNILNMSTELAAIKKERTDEKFSLVIAKGVESGRILPAQINNAEWIGTQRSWADKNFASFEEYFTLKAPIIGPVAPGLEKAIVAGNNNRTSPLTDNDLVVAKNMGVTKEQLDKYNK